MDYKRELKIDKAIPKVYPFCEALLALRPVEVHCFSSCNKLNQHNPKGINISFFCNLTTLSIFWSQIPAAEQHILMNTAIAMKMLKRKGHHPNLPKCSYHSRFNASITIRLPPRQAKITNLAIKAELY